MEKKIKILLIEDNTGDAYLIEEQLKEFANFLYKFRNVKTLNEALRNDKNIISSISVTDIVFDDYLGKWNYRAIPK
jgi:hypothetical protein